jgi:hypothetical protein
MKEAWSTLALLLLSVWCLSGYPAAAQSELPHLLPSNVDAFGFTADLPSTRLKWKQTNLYRMLQDEAMQPAIRGLKAELQGFIEDFGGPLDEFIDLFDNNFCFALSRESGDANKPFTLVLAETETRDGAERIVRRIEDRLQKAARPIKKELVDNVPVYLADSPYGRLAFFFEDKLFCLSFNSRQAVHSVARKVKSAGNASPANSIVDAAEFARHKSQLEHFVKLESSHFFVWMRDPLEWLQTLEALLLDRPFVRRFVRNAATIGTGDVRSIGGAMKIHSDGSELQTSQKIVLVPEEKPSGIFSLLSEQSIRERPEQLVVEGNRMEISASWHPALWSNMAELVVRMYRDDLGLAPRSFLTYFSEMKAANPELNFDELTGQFTGQVNGMIHSELEYSQPTETESAVYAFDVKDSEVVAKFLAQFATAKKGLGLYKMTYEGFPNGIWSIENGNKGAVFVAQHRLFYVSQWSHVGPILRKISRGHGKPDWLAPLALPLRQALFTEEESSPLVAQGTMEIATVLRFNAVESSFKALKAVLSYIAPKLDTLHWPKLKELEKYLGIATFEVVHDPKNDDASEVFWVHGRIFPPIVNSPKTIEK